MSYYTLNNYKSYIKNLEKKDNFENWFNWITNGQYVLCNDILEMVCNNGLCVEEYNTWYEDEDEEEGTYDYYPEIYQYFITNMDIDDITSWEIPSFYIDDLNITVIGITHFGTGWDYVPSPSYIMEKEEF